jgi:hypothetical protein
MPRFGPPIEMARWQAGDQARDGRRCGVPAGLAASGSAQDETSRNPASPRPAVVAHMCPDMLRTRRRRAAERVAFVPHDLFAIPFDEIATAVRRSPVASKRLASRARTGFVARRPSARSISPATTPSSRRSWPPHPATRHASRKSAG